MGRVKKFRKYLDFYKINYGINGPFWILVDPSFWVTCIQKHVEVKRLMGKLVQNQVYICATQCVRRDKRFASVGKDNNSWLNYVRCNHGGGEMLKPHDCMMSHLKGGEKKYCVASEDNAFKTQISNMPGVPLFFLYNNILMLQRPSSASYKQIKANQLATQGISKSLKKQVDEAQQEMHPKRAKLDAAITHVHRQNKKAKGPNPLSCKKKQPKQHQPSETTQTTTNTNTETEDNKNKRKRHRVRKTKKPDEAPINTENDDTNTHNHKKEKKYEKEPANEASGGEDTTASEAQPKKKRKTE